MRRLSLLVFAVTMFAASHLKADTILFRDNHGAASETIPAYYIAQCVGGVCGGVDIYDFTVVTNTIPATTYIGGPGGYVSDKVVTTISPPSSCTPMPSCLGNANVVRFDFTAGLDLTSSPFTCASVGGCQFAYNGSVQDVGVITWGPGVLTPPSGFTTNLQFQSLTGTSLTTTLFDFLGGSSSDPTLLPSGQPVAQITGTIGEFGSQDYYTFLWAGGVFSATASITDVPDPGASYLFSEGVAGSCGTGSTRTLDISNTFTGTIAIPNLAPGQYCIGIEATSPLDPNFALTFHTPVSGVPEPASFVLLSLGLGIGSVLRGTKRSRQGA